jgi:high-affinity iron transporter
MVWQAAMAPGSHDPVAQTSATAAMVDISVLVFREGLECVLVLAAILAGMGEGRGVSRNPIAIGAGAGFSATVLTWFAAVRILDDLSQSVSALALQAATGLVAVIVLLVVMNWFFHKFYWTGWISFHNRRKHELMASENGAGWIWGMALLGFTSLYREGFEVVLFLQSYRLRLGGETVFWGTCMGLALTGIVAVLTFVAHRKMPYRKMLVLTGGLLGVVLVVMVGEQVQEMQLAHWVSTTTIPSLARLLPAWMGTWLSVFPTVETLVAQVAAAVLVVGSYVFVNLARGGGDASRDQRGRQGRRADRGGLKRRAQSAKPTEPTAKAKSKTPTEKRVQNSRATVAATKSTASSKPPPKRRSLQDQNRSQTAAIERLPRPGACVWAAGKG